MAQPVLSSIIPEGSRFCNRCGSPLAPPGLVCTACGHGGGAGVDNKNMMFVPQPTITQMIEAGSTDVPPPYEQPDQQQQQQQYQHQLSPSQHQQQLQQQPSAPYEPVGSPSAPHMILITPPSPSLQPYGIQPTMAHQGSHPGYAVGVPLSGHMTMGGQMPMGMPIYGGQGGQGGMLMVGVPLGGYEQKGEGPAYPSPALPSGDSPPVGDWKAMRSPFATLTLPRLWLTREVNLSLLPLPKKDHEIRCLKMRHEPGVPLPEGLDVTETGNLVGQPTTPLLMKEFFFMAQLRMGLSTREKMKRKAQREKEHKKIVKKQQKQHEAVLKKNPSMKPYEPPALPPASPEETDEIKWVLIRVKIAILSRVESFLVATFCRGIPCLFTGPLMEEGQCWLVPCFFLPAFPFAVFVDLPCKAAALFYLILAIPFYTIMGFLSDNLPESLFPAFAIAEGCCGGVDQEATRQVQAVHMSQVRANRGGMKTSLLFTRSFFDLSSEFFYSMCMVSNSSYHRFAKHF